MQCACRVIREEHFGGIKAESWPLLHSTCLLFIVYLYLSFSDKLHILKLIERKDVRFKLKLRSVCKGAIMSNLEQVSSGFCIRHVESEQL